MAGQQPMVDRPYMAEAGWEFCPVHPTGLCFPQGRANIADLG
jgi:hypothetical protein